MDTHFFAGLTKFKIDAGKFRRDDDFSDRFNHTFTTLLLIIFTLIISARQYVGKPIACWVPTEFTRAQEEYAESVCWVTSTYFIDPRNAEVPTNRSVRYSNTIHYYQWVPFILMLQAFLFNLPCILWRLFNWQSGIHLSSIMEVSCDIEMIKDPETRRSNVVYVARHIEDSLTNQREYRAGCTVKCRQCLAKSCCLWFGKRYGNYLVCLYLIMKVFYVTNVVGQFFIMNRFLNSTKTFYGLDLLRELAMGIEWSQSGNFPRTTLCDFEVRKVGGNMHTYTIQCVLPINMFNEKIFIFLWFWFVLVSSITLTSFFYWAYKCSLRGARIQFIKKFLKLRDAVESNNKKKSYAFVDNYLRPDGVFILRLIAQNAGELVTAEIIERLWFIYNRHHAMPSLVNGVGDPIMAHKKQQPLPSLKYLPKRSLGFASQQQTTTGNNGCVPPPLPPHPQLRLHNHGSNNNTANTSTSSNADLDVCQTMKEQRKEPSTNPTTINQNRNKESDEPGEFV